MCACGNRGLQLHVDPCPGRHLWVDSLWVSFKRQQTIGVLTTAQSVPHKNKLFSFPCRKICRCVLSWLPTVLSLGNCFHTSTGCYVQMKSYKPLRPMVVSFVWSTQGCTLYESCVLLCSIIGPGRSFCKQLC